MKKTVFLAVLATTAIVASSCSAPTISIEQAREEAAAIKAKMDQNNYEGGFFGLQSTLDVSVYLKSKTDKEEIIFDTKGYISFDVEQLYLRSEIEVYAKSTEGSEKVKQSSVMYYEDDTSKLYIKSNIDGEKSEDSVDLNLNGAKEYFDNMYESVTEQYADEFESTAEEMLEILSASEEFLSSLGIKLGSYGEGSLVFEQTSKQEVEGSSFESFSKVEFKDYMFSSVETRIKQEYKGSFAEQKASVKVSNSARYNYSV